MGLSADDAWHDFENPFGVDLDAVFGELPQEQRGEIQRFIESIRKSLTKGDPRRHHYVPRAYQNRFARDELICRVGFDNPLKVDELKTVDNAVVKDLYTVIDKEFGETVAVERLLARVDGAAGAPMDRLILGVFFPPQTNDRVQLALFLGMLHVRALHRRRTAEALGDMLLKAELQWIKTEEDVREHFYWTNGGAGPSDEEIAEALNWIRHLEEWEVAPHQNEHVKLMLRTGLSLVPHILGRLWTVCRLAEPGLMISDSPLILYQKPENRVPGLGVGLANADEVWLPLDRRTVLMLHNDVVVGERVIPAQSEYDVDMFNQMIVDQAIDEIYFHPDDRHRLTKLNPGLLTYAQ